MELAVWIALDSGKEPKACEVRAKHVTPHAFRHATAVHLISAGVDVTVRGVGDVGGRRRVWHNGRRDGAGRTRKRRSASQARKADVVPVRELPYRPAAMALLIKAGQMTASDYVLICPDLPLASDGASTDAVWLPRSGNSVLILISGCHAYSANFPSNRFAQSLLFSL